MGTRFSRREVLAAACAAASLAPLGARAERKIRADRRGRAIRHRPMAFRCDRERQARCRRGFHPFAAPLGIQQRGGHSASRAAGRYRDHRLVLGDASKEPRRRLPVHAIYGGAGRRHCPGGEPDKDDLRSQGKGNRRRRRANRQELDLVARLRHQAGRGRSRFHRKTRFWRASASERAGGGGAGGRAPEFLALRGKA